MLKINELVFRAPCGIHGELGISQLESRLEAGFVPLFILKKKLSEKEGTVFKDYCKNFHPKDIAFSLSTHNNEGGFDYDNQILRYVEELSHVHGFQASVDIKLDSASNPSSITDYHCSFTLSEYLHKFNNNIDFLYRFIDAAAKKNIIVEIENRPRPNYGFSPDGSGIILDPNPRWAGKWSAYPRNIGTFCANAQEISAIMEKISDAHVQLDIEHLIQTIQWGSIFNLHNANEGILRFGDLSDKQKRILMNYGFNFEDNEILFDLGDISEDENEFMDKYGFIVRENLPIIYKNRLTLQNELEKLKDLNIFVMTPGFQVYQGFYDMNPSINEQILTIGSHMPGIQKKYIRDKTIRQELMEGVRVIHSYCWQFIQEKGINVIELEPSMSYNENIVMGDTNTRQQWIRQMDEAKKQMLYNFSLAESDKIDKALAPDYVQSD